MGAGLQVVGVLLGVVSWCLQSSCTSSHVWRTRSQMESVTSSQTQFEGLWMSCAATSLGSIQCSRFKTLLGLPGVFTLVAVSWYASRVIHDFHEPMYGGVRYELGSGLYLGWAASALALLGGSLLCCSYRRPPQAARPFSYKLRSQDQSIYRAAAALDDDLSKVYV